GEQHFHDLALSIAWREIEHERNLGEIGMLRRRYLKENAKPVLAQPIGTGADERAIGHAAASFDLAALERNVEVIAARIAADDPHLRAEHVVDDQRENISVVAGARAS